MCELPATERANNSEAPRLDTPLPPEQDEAPDTQRFHDYLFPDSVIELAADRPVLAPDSPSLFGSWQMQPSPTAVSTSTQEMQEVKRPSGPDGTHPAHRDGSV